MSEINSRADLFEAAAKMMRMCDEAGVPYAYKYDGELYNVVPVCGRDICAYEFPLAFVEGKPVFKGDELFLPNGEKVIAGKDGTPISVIGASCSWLPPKPRTVLVELLREDAEWLAKHWDGEAFTYDAQRVSKTIRKALEEK